MVNFTAADRVGAIGGYIGGIEALGKILGGRGGLFGRENYDEDGGGKYRHKVTEHELNLVQQNNCLLSENSTLKSEKYTDNKIAALSAEIYRLNEKIAVSAAHGQDFAKYVECEFVHQPKASIKENIIVCRQCRCEDCCCDKKKNDYYPV